MVQSLTFRPCSEGGISPQDPCVCELDARPAIGRPRGNFKSVLKVAGSEKPISHGVVIVRHRRAGAADGGVPPRPEPAA